MKIVGITQRVVVDPEHGERRDALDQRWPCFISACDLACVALPNDAEIAIQLADQLGLAGIIFTGGEDLIEYGGRAPERDMTELALLNWVRSRKIPLLGVCRGMQVVQHSFGVKLERVTGHVTTSHPLATESVMRDVNSYHNYASIQDSPDLVAWAHAADGYIEAIRHRNENIIGVMWHPERNAPFDLHDIDLFKSFFGAE